MSWHYTAYRSRIMVKERSLCVIKTHGGMDIDSRTLSLEVVSYKSGRFTPRHPADRRVARPQKLTGHCGAEGNFFLALPRFLGRPASRICHYIEWATPASQKVWRKEIPVSVLTDVFISSEFPELQQPMLEDQRMFHNVLVYSLGKWHRSISVLIVGIYLQPILDIKFKQDMIFSELLVQPYKICPYIIMRSVLQQRTCI